jgi:hypothetical protein
MSSNYPEGSMFGSGIYSTDVIAWFFCSQCDTEIECEATTDDWHTKAYADCPTCESELEMELPSKEEIQNDYWSDYNPNN